MTSWLTMKKWNLPHTEDLILITLRLIFASGNASIFSLTMSFNLESIINIGISRLLHFLGS